MVKQTDAYFRPIADIASEARLSLIRGCCYRLCVRGSQLNGNAAQGDALSARKTVVARLTPQASRAASYSIGTQVIIGIAAAALAVGIRAALPLHPNQIPTLALVVSLAIVTSFVGIWCGVVTAVVGGIMSFPLFIRPGLDRFDGWIPVISYVVIAAVIITTSQLYRTSEQRRYEGELTRLQLQADTADLFAKELSHRLKNTLAIVQSIAFQTIGSDSDEAHLFSSRLRTLADANDLLNEHVSHPHAELRDVIRSAIAPFDDGDDRFKVNDVTARIPSQQVLMLALAVHELATNAVKYGALSNGVGAVTIHLEEVERGIIMTWRERGGPRVTEPAVRGFGTRLLERIGTNAKLDFASDGLVCTAEIRTAAV